MPGGLHDSIGQYLTAIKFAAENLVEILQRQEWDAAMRNLETGIPMIRQTIDELRHIMMDLRPTILDDLGISATLSWLCRGLQKLHSQIHFEKDLRIEESNVPEPLKIVIYRIAQEALNNAIKYSQAKRIKISLYKSRKRIVLAVTDNGVGFDPDAKPAPGPERGIGLISMRERAELSEGVLTVRTELGKGTTVKATWAA